ncbi:MAG: hypothetical protein QHC89_21415 [Bosea sp. (in: a-proteobacteria)]|nr:hypothetical protein [Bosea sp. (in: a-proteobacteria)]
MITRRGVLAAAALGLSAAVLPADAGAVAPVAEPRLAVLLTLSGERRLLRALQAHGISVASAHAEALLLQTDALLAYRGRRLLHIGSAADQVLVGLALADHAVGARILHRAFHDEPVRGQGSVHGIASAPGWSCAAGLARDLGAAGQKCRLQGAALTTLNTAASTPPIHAARWQAVTLAHLIARASPESGAAAHTPRWDHAPATFSSLIADI